MAAWQIVLIVAAAWVGAAVLVCVCWSLIARHLRAQRRDREDPR
jgi:hypothetical protein